MNYMSNGRSPAAEAEPDVLNAVLDQHWSLARLEREYILRVLDATRGHRGRAADILGIDRRTLYRKLRQYGAGKAVRVLR